MTTNPETSKRSVIAGCVLVVLLFLGFSIIGTLILHSFGLYKITAGRILLSTLICWLCLGIIWLYSIKIEKQPFLIWEEKGYKWDEYIKAFFAILGAIFLGAVLIGIILLITHQQRHSIKFEEMIAVFRANKWLAVLTAITAGFTEELTMRGYLLPRLQQLSINPWITIFISALVFGLLHYTYGTLANMLFPFMMGLVFAYYYWKFRNIRILIFFHFLWDVVVMFANFSPHHFQH